MSWNRFGFRPYVPVAQRQANAKRQVAKLVKKGQAVLPVNIEGRTIAHSFWGKAWCDNLESYMDYANRLPRGRTYVRNGSVVHLDISPGKIEAMVSGSELYRVKIQISPTAKARWESLCQECAGGIGSLLELLQGRFSDQVMSVFTSKEKGLFPSPKEIKLECSCPDWATMCKHVAAVLYGVGARLDQSPELLFRLRSVNHEDLLAQVAKASDLAAKGADTGLELPESELSAVFGIELDTQAAPTPAPKPPAPKKKPVPPAKPAPKAKDKGKIKRIAPKKGPLKSAKRKQPKVDPKRSRPKS
jgi:uncharacterized Zn finger protein